ncbi:MAG TPA: hypothetical protein VK824_10610, partial [Planctomycetota bacterium]|nr:hypothetical protein [Planctomycetota bacterium]
MPTPGASPQRVSTGARLVRVSLALAAAAAVAAGAVTLATGKPLRPALATLLRRDAGRAGEVELNAGFYRVHADPLVSYVLAPGTDRELFAARVRADAWHVVVAGDSVAFGFGLEEEQTIEARLELELNAALGPGARPVECRSVALPGWNHRNAVAAVLDHEDVLDPDIVVYLPIGNDVFDTDAMDETGHRRTACDPASADPWLLANQSNDGRLQLESARRLREAGRDDSSAVRGPQAITADLSPESWRRFDENAASIERLRARMAGRGGRFLLATLQQEDPYAQHLLARLAGQELPVDVLPLFTMVPEALKLRGDPHPNAEAASAMARWIAGDLLRRGWLTGEADAKPAVQGEAAAARVPEVAPEIQAVHAALLAPDELCARAARTRSLLASRLRPVVDVQAGEGCNQIFGGVLIDGVAEPHSLYLLPRPAQHLLVQLAPLADRPALLPQDVRVQIDGVDVGSVHLQGAAPVTAHFAVPPPRPSPGQPPRATAPDAATPDATVPGATVPDATVPGATVPGAT